MIPNLLDWKMILTLIICSMIYYFNNKNKHFLRHGVVSTRNPLPIFGHMFRVFTGKEHLLQTIFRAYTSHPDEKFFGFYAFNKPIIVLKDLELIKQITVKDFDHFMDHKVFFDEQDDPLFGKNLFFLKGQKWKDMRIAMSPAYTASKMKSMMPFVMECAEKTINYLNDLTIQKNNEKTLQIEMKDVFSRFTNDVIASTAFGIQVNSFQDVDNNFYLMGKRATNFSGVQFLKFFGYSSCPKLMKLFNIPLFHTEVKSFFRKVVREAIEMRENNKSLRPDMIHLLMLAKKGSLGYDVDASNVEDTDYLNYKESSKNGVVKREWSHDDLTAQAVAFLLAGFDTSSNLLCFAAYELARHPHIQQRLQQEIDAHNSQGKITYLELNKMKYMDMVVSESLRMWPPDSLLERVCTKTYLLPHQNDSTSIQYQVNKGEDIMIPTYSIHHDPRNHPNPETFNPERFSDENKPFMSPFSFIPFGVGPRTCIGSRFAVMEVKVMLYYLLSAFDITITPKTTIPLQLATDTFTLNSLNGFWLGLKLRK